MILILLQCWKSKELKNVFYDRMNGDIFHPKTQFKPGNYCTYILPQPTKFHPGNGREPFIFPFLCCFFWDKVKAELISICKLYLGLATRERLKALQNKVL